MNDAINLGFAICGSFCTHEKALNALSDICKEYSSVQPILSEICCKTDTRFGKAADLKEKVEHLCGKSVISMVAQAEPIGPKKLLDVLVIAPCTGNTLAKISRGITDSTVTMACKAHMRNGRPVVIALASNDALAANAENLGRLLVRNGVYFVPFGQDDSAGKPASLVADFSKIPDTVREAIKGKQIQPILL